MVYEVMKPATGLEVGETYGLEDISKKGDLNTMVRKGIIRAVGFVSTGAPMNDSEAARTIAELQKKLEDAEDERDRSREDVKELNRKIRALEAGHAEGAKQLAAETARANQLAADLAACRGKIG